MVESGEWGVGSDVKRPPTAFGGVETTIGVVACEKEPHRRQVS